jgi:hypothetical protein
MDRKHRSSTAILGPNDWVYHDRPKRSIKGISHVNRTSLQDNQVTIDHSSLGPSNENPAADCYGVGIRSTRSTECDSYSIRSFAVRHVKHL